MYELIQQIIAKFGGRLSGSQAERDAQAWFQEKLSIFCGDRVSAQPFKAPMEAKFESLKLFFFLFFVSLALYKVNLYAALGLSVANAVVFAAHFVTYRDWLDPFWKKQDSVNITGTLEPKGEVRSTLMIAGHMDCVREFQWWYRLKHTGVVFTFLSSIIILVLPVFYGLVVILAEAGVFTSEPLWPDIVWYVFLGLCPFTIVMWNIHGKRVVDGAIDNLTGVALAYGVGEAFADREHPGTSTLQHTRLKLVSFGGEEAGLRGAKAYAKAFEQELKDEKAALINIDSIRDADHLCILKGEFNTFAKFSPPMVADFEQAFHDCKVPVIKTTLTMGASDASAFAWRNLPCVSLIGLSVKRLDPTYHTRLDTLENLDPKGMEETGKVLAHFVREWDAGRLGSKVFS